MSVLTDGYVTAKPLLWWFFLFFTVFNLIFVNNLTIAVNINTIWWNKWITENNKHFVYKNNRFCMFFIEVMFFYTFSLENSIPNFKLKYKSYNSNNEQAKVFQINYLHLSPIINGHPNSVILNILKLNNKKTLCIKKSIK